MPNTAQPNTGRPRSRLITALIVVGALLLAAILLVAFLFWPKFGLFAGPEARAASATDCVVEHLTTQGWVQDTDFTTDLTVQDGDEIFSSGASAFSANPIFSTAELGEFLKSGDARAELATQVVQSAVGDKDVQWVGIKYLVPIQIEGNLGTDGATVVDFGTRNSGAGEIIFYPVDMANCQVIEGIIIRAGCGNPGKGVIPPCRENCVPPKEKCPPDMPHGTPEACKDGVEAGPNEQGNLPDQQKPNPLPADPDHAQPTEPSPPPATYTPPPEPPVEPAPDVKPNPPAPPAPPPVVVEEDQDLGDGGEPNW